MFYMEISYAAAEAACTTWAEVHGGRDQVVTDAWRAGLSKQRIHLLTGISRVTIDKILAGQEEQ